MARGHEQLLVSSVETKQKQRSHDHHTPPNLQSKPIRGRPSPTFFTNSGAAESLRLLPVTEPDQDGPVELVLGAVGLGAAGVDEGVDGSQEEALLVELLQLARQFPHRGEAERGRPTWQTAETEETSETEGLVSMTLRLRASGGSYLERERETAILMFYVLNCRLFHCLCLFLHPS